MPNSLSQTPDFHPRPAPTRSEDDEGQEASGYRFRRLRDAARRVRWIAGALIVLGVVGGYWASRVVTPLYDLKATVYLGAQRGDAPRQGPIVEQQFVSREASVELLRSFRVLEPVAVKLRTFVWVADSAEGKAAFERLAVTDDVTAGIYQLEILPDNRGYRLSLSSKNTVMAQGTLPDSIGKALGLRWYVTAGEIPVGLHKFGVISPRDAALVLNDRIETSLPQNGQILTLRLSDTDPQRGARTLNTLVEQFMTVSRELQETQSDEYSVALREQLKVAEARLRGAEQALQSVRSSNITAPVQGSTGVADPMTGEYYAKRVRLENLRRDRRALEQLLQSGGTVSIEGLMAIPSVAQSSALNEALQDLSKKEGQLRAARQQYSDEFTIVRDLVAQIATLRRETIPRLASSKLEELRISERDIDQSVTAYTGELRKSPKRDLDEVRAKRDFDVADQFYTSLLSRWNEVRLASEGATDEMKVLDRAVPPSRPTRNSKRTLLAGGLALGLGLAAFLIFLTDRFDPRLRQPEEVLKDLRLKLLARVPLLPLHTRSDTNLLVAAQAIEAFRTVRMRLQQEFDGRGRIMVVVTSEGVNEGKSLISANLAATFAEAGIRTLLVDGDLRRGSQHESYGVQQSPGFTDVLVSGEALESVIQATSTPNLSVLATGRRSRRVPELLNRGRLAELLADMRRDFEVVIIDTAPLGAGVDTYALSVAAGAMLMVLRHGTTNLKAADSRLAAIDQLPVRIVGAILNGVPTSRAFATYDDTYSYLSDYALTGGDAPQAMLPRSSKGSSDS